MLLHEGGCRSYSIPVIHTEFDFEEMRIMSDANISKQDGLFVFAIAAIITVLGLVGTNI